MSSSPTTTMADDTKSMVTDITGDGGVLKEILVEGVGDETPVGKVSVHYEGTLMNGRLFDSSITRETPFEFDLGKGSVIKAWDIGVATMKKGEKAVLTCAPEYAYGESGSPPTIPPNSTLKFQIELLGWGDMTNVDTNGSVRKKMLTTGSATDYETPNDYSVCEVSYQLKAGNQVVAEKLNASIEVGLEASICQGLEDVIKSLKKGEKCDFEIAPSHGYGASGEPSMDIPPNARLTGTVELLSFEKGVQKYSMSQPEKISYAEKRKNVGNDLFKCGQLMRAKKMYQAGVGHIEFEKNLPSNGTDLFVAINSNIAAAHLKEGNLSEAKKACDSALKRNPNYFKSLFRRAQALAGMGAPDDALVDLKTAIQLDQSNASVRSLLAKCKAKVKAQIAKERSTYGGIFERMSKVEEKPEATKPIDRMEAEPILPETEA